MSKPTKHIQLTGLLTPSERTWAAIRRMAKRKPSSMTALEVQDACLPMVTYNTVRTLLDKFTTLGHMSKQPGVLIPGEGNRRSAPAYTLIKDQLDPPSGGRDGKPATARGIGRLAMWRAMKVLKTFDGLELAQHAGAGTVHVSDRTASDYLSALSVAGHVRKEPTAKGQRQRYRLVNWTGTKAPLFTTAKCVVDANTGVVTLLSSAQEMVDGQE